MNFIIIASGLLIIAYGCYTAVMRVKAPGKFSKIESMKHFWGDKLGYFMHILAYSILPIIVGSILTLISILRAMVINTP